MMDFIWRKRICFVLGAFLVLGMTIAAGGEARSVQQILSTQDDNEPVWETSTALRALGDAAAEEITTIANNGAETSVRRLAAGTALLQMGDQRNGTLALEALIIDETVPLNRRMEAGQMLAKWGGEYAAARLGLLMDEQQLPERLRVELAYGLWKLAARPQAYDTLESIRKDGKSSQARAEALLALGQTNRYPFLESELKLLAERPGPLGERAQSIIIINARHEDDVKRDDYTQKLLAEVVQKVSDYYAVDENDKDQLKRMEPKSLAETSAQALLYTIDQFNDYLNEEDFADFDAQLRANYGGIGAYVGTRDGRFTILTPMFDKPAYVAGLRPMDVIDRIDDTDITAMKQNDIIKMLRGEPGSKVRVRVWRKGWREGRMFEVVRKVIQIDSVFSQVLPGNIGYIKINTFNDGDPYKRIKGTAALVEDALAKFNKAGIKATVVDLSNNPGGVLGSGVDVASLFIGRREVIVTSKGKRNKNNPTIYRASYGAPFYQKPVAMLVNGGTASAAEILAGAMRDYNRALLIGQKTYGKGSVQQLMGVRTAKDTSRIKLTVAKYYLPKGEGIHHKGIQPDHKIKETDYSASEIEVRWRIRDQHDIHFWLDEDNRWQRYENRFRDLLVFDDYNPDNYPEFDSLYAMLKTKYSKESFDRDFVRRELRNALISYLREYKGEPYYVDLEEDASLQDAVVSLGDAIGGLPNTPLFNAIKTRVTEARQEMAASENGNEEEEGF